MGMPYKKKIDAPWVLEVISENFDGALELMTDSNVVYGGAVRDALANIPLEGDLDIAVSTMSNNKQIQMFNESLKWKPISKKQDIDSDGRSLKYLRYVGADNKDYRPVTQSTANSLGYQVTMISRQQTKELMTVHINNDHDTTNIFSVKRVSGKFTAINNDSIHIVKDNDNIFYHDPGGKIGRLAKYGASTLSQVSTTPSYRSQSKINSVLQRGNSYGKNVPMSAVSNFEGIGGVKAQIVISKGSTQNAIDDVFKVVREVDILCCGVAMDKEGAIYELVEHAYEDCKNKILRLNPIVLTAELEISILEKRIERLTKRGWESKINLKEVASKIKKMKTSADKKAKARFERHKTRMAAKKKKNEKKNLTESMVDFSEDTLKAIFKNKDKPPTWFSYYIENSYLTEHSVTTDLKSILINIASKFGAVGKKILIQRNSLGMKGRTKFFVANSEFTDTEKRFLFGDSDRFLRYIGSNKSLPHGMYDDLESFKSDPSKILPDEMYNNEKTINTVYKTVKETKHQTHTNPFRNSKKRVLSKHEASKYLTNYKSTIGVHEIEEVWGGYDTAYKIIKRRIDNASVPGMKLAKALNKEKIIFECNTPIRRDIAESIMSLPTNYERIRAGSNKDGHSKIPMYPKPITGKQKITTSSYHNYSAFHTTYKHCVQNEDINRYWDGDTEHCIATLSSKARGLGIKINTEIKSYGVMCVLHRKKPFSDRTVSHIFIPTEEENVKTRENSKVNATMERLKKLHITESTQNVLDAKINISKKIDMDIIRNKWGSFREFNIDISRTCEYNNVRVDFTIRDNYVLVTFKSNKTISTNALSLILDSPSSKHVSIKTTKKLKSKRSTQNNQHEQSISVGGEDE